MEGDFHAFTESYCCISRTLISSVTIRYNEQEVKARALWDTGATTTCISYKIRDDLHMISEGSTTITNSSSIMTKQESYTIDILLPDSILISGLRVLDTNLLDPRYDCLIGMDIITRGDLTISNFQEQTVLTFRTPSQERKDYATEYVDSIKQQQEIVSQDPTQ